VRLDAPAAGDTVITLDRASESWPAARIVQTALLGDVARSSPPGVRVVVVGSDMLGAAAAAERLAALGVPAAWVGAEGAA
jgi:16S rRNA G1207 methylase RsmC